jgi:hypothetical protein
LKKSILFLAIAATFTTQAGNHIQFFKDGFAQINLEKKIIKDETTLNLPFSTVLESLDVNAKNGKLIDSYSISRSNGNNANSFYEIDFDIESDMDIKYEYQVGDIQWKPKYFVYFNDKGTFEFKYNLEIKNDTSTKYENFTSDFIFYDIGFRVYDSYNIEKKEDLSQISFDNDGNKIIIKEKKEGFNKNGFNKNGFDQYGFDKNGFNKEGYDRNVYNYGNDLVEKIEDINVLNYNKNITLKPNSMKNISYFKDTYSSEKITYKFNYHDTSVIEEICHYSNLDNSIHNKMDDGVIRTFKTTNKNNYLINEDNFSKKDDGKELEICLDQKTMPKTSFSDLSSSIIKETKYDTKDFHVTIALVNNVLILKDNTIDTKKYALLANKSLQENGALINEEIVVSEKREGVINDLYSYEISNYKMKTDKMNSIMNNLSFSDKTTQEINNEFGLLSKDRPVNSIHYNNNEIEIVNGKLEFETVKVSVIKKK